MSEQTNTAAPIDPRLVDIESKLAALGTQTTALQAANNARAQQIGHIYGFVADMVASAKTIAQMAATRPHIATIGSVSSVHGAAGEAKRRAELLAQLVSPPMEELAADEGKQAEVLQASDWAAEVGVLCDAAYEWLVAVVEETCQEPGE